MTSIDNIIAEHSDKTAIELNAWVKDNPTGDIITQKARSRAIAQKQRTEDQTVADSFLNTKDYPKSEAMMGKDVRGKHIKIYLDGMIVFDDNGEVV